MWICVDGEGRVLGVNEDDMSGCTGWTFVPGVSLQPDAEIEDPRGAALYKLVDGTFVRRTAQERMADWPEEETVVSPTQRIAELEAMLTETQLALCEIFEAMEALQ